MIRVVIADDQRLFAESLQFVLQGASQGRVEVTGIAENGEEAVSMVKRDRPAVVLMDVRMPVMDGVQATRIIHKNYPETKVLILTTFDDDDLAVRALSSGATGYVLKDVAAEDLILSIEAVAKGVFYIAPSVGLKLIDKMSTREQHDESAKQRAVAGLIARYAAFTRREAEIVYLAALALTNAEIGTQLSISDKTVKNHLSAIFGKLKIHSRLQLISRIAPVLQELHG